MSQPEFEFFQPNTLDSAWLVNLLRGKGWMTAAAILSQIGTKDSESGRRRLRAVAQSSDGKIGSGQQGYKLVEEMTKAEFDHFCNWMLHQTEEMQRRIVVAQKLWYSRNPVPA